jgi:hypothetical protein
MRLAPDPATDLTRLLIDGHEGPVRCTIMDAQGRIVQESATDPDGLVDVAALAPGRYTVIAWSGMARYVAALMKLP